MEPQGVQVDNGRYPSPARASAPARYRDGYDCTYFLAYARQAGGSTFRSINARGQTDKSRMTDHPAMISAAWPTRLAEPGRRLRGLDAATTPGPARQVAEVEPTRWVRTMHLLPDQRPSRCSGRVIAFYCPLLIVS
jgi:hypothetical protein